MKRQKGSPRFLLFPILGIAIIYLLIGTILITNLKVNSNVIQNTIVNLSSKDVFAHFLRAENHYFYQKGEEEIFTLSDTSKLAIHDTTNMTQTLHEKSLRSTKAYTVSGDIVHEELDFYKHKGLSIWNSLMLMQ